MANPSGRALWIAAVAFVTAATVVGIIVGLAGIR